MLAKGSRQASGTYRCSVAGNKVAEFATAPVALAGCGCGCPFMWPQAIHTYILVNIHMYPLEHTHPSLHTHTPFAIAPQSCNAIRFYVASAVAASALKQLPLHAVAVVVAVAMTVTTACALLSTRHAKILQQQQQQLCQLLVGSAKGASSDLFA